MSPHFHSILYIRGPIDALAWRGYRDGERMRRAELLDDSAAEMLRRLYV